MQRFYKLYIDRVKIYNLFSARGYSIETPHATPISYDKIISSIEMKAIFMKDKITNIKEKFLQIASIRDVEVYVFDRVI